MLDINSTEVIKVIDHLKDIITPIGVEVYKIYYTQIFYNGIINVTINLFFIIIMPYVTYKCWKFVPINENDEYDDAYGSIAIIVTIITIIGMLISIFVLPNNIMHVINPDYYIIQELLSKV